MKIKVLAASHEMQKIYIPGREYDIIQFYTHIKVPGEQNYKWENEEFRNVGEFIQFFKKRDNQDKYWVEFEKLENKGNYNYLALQMIIYVSLILFSAFFAIMVVYY